VGSNGTLVNAPEYTAPTPTYFSFNGTNQTATTANLKASFASSNSQTLEIWVRTASDNGVVISQQGTSPINSGYHLSVIEIVSGELKVGLWQEPTLPGSIANVTVGAVTRDEWQQYVLTYDDDTNTLTGYINAANPAVATVENVPPSPEWYYALCQADVTNMGDGSSLAADIGLFRVWNTALSAAEVEAIYNENLARFSVEPAITSFTTAETTTWTAPAGVTEVEYLVVAGGGGGGNGYDNGGGGGGGGGMALSGTLSVTPGNSYTITVGDGGAGGVGDPGVGFRSNANGATGSNSVFASITALGGGAGGGSRTGGSPGAAQVGSTTAPTGGNGNGGGNAGDGGGGATGAGTENTSTGGTGGAGLTSAITGSSTVYSAGGNGADNITSTGAAGANNTGNGGGGGGGSSAAFGNGGNGGSGIVVIKYGQ